MKYQKKATIIGLGIMGTTLAELLIKNQYKTTVWNRTSDKVKDFANKGANVANSAIEAIKSSEVTIICISDYAAITNLLSNDSELQTLQGKTVINLTTGIPSEANKMNEFFNQLNVKYLDGAILSFADQMGKSDTTLIFSGNEQVFKKYENTLKIFGGNLKYLGTRPGGASALDQSVLVYMYGALTGFFHGVLFAEKEGIDISLLGEVINHVTPGMGHFVKHEAEQIQAGTFDLSLSSVAMNARAVTNIYRASKDYGLNLHFPEMLQRQYFRAMKLGLIDKELASLIKVFREIDNHT